MTAEHPRKVPILGPPHWYACQNPERPNDPYVVWHFGSCHGCHVAAIATARRYPDDLQVANIVDLTRPRDGWQPGSTGRVVPRPTGPFRP